MTYAELDGFHAYNDNVPLSACPYRTDAAQAEWRRGWLAAEKAADDRADAEWFKG
jgi:ribosome modulation factor